MQEKTTSTSVQPETTLQTQAHPHHHTTVLFHHEPHQHHTDDGTSELRTEMHHDYRTTSCP